MLGKEYKEATLQADYWWILTRLRRGSWHLNSSKNQVILIILMVVPIYQMSHTISQALCSGLCKMISFDHYGNLVNGSNNLTVLNFRLLTCKIKIIMMTSITKLPSSVKRQIFKTRCIWLRRINVPRTRLEIKYLDFSYLWLQRNELCASRSER